MEDDDIRLEKTIFYPRGGGQPADKGQVIHQGQEYTVDKIKRTKDGIYLKLKGDTSALQPGDTVLQQVDWDYRYQLMKHHTSLHILSAVVWDKFEAKVTGGTIYQNKARLDFDLDDFSQELAEELVDEVNDIIAQDHQIEISFVDREVAESDPALIRTKINLLPKFITEIRLVKIGDVDIQADGGLHVHSTAEIGRIKLIDTDNKGKGRKRIAIGTVS